MTETSLFPQAVAAAGLDLGALWQDLVERAATRVRDVPRLPPRRTVRDQDRSGSSSPTMRSRSSSEANSMVILPLVRPRSTLTRVSSRSDSRSARSCEPGATGACARARERRRRSRSSPTVTISSTARTDSPSATMRCASRSCASGVVERRAAPGRARPTARRPRPAAGPPAGGRSSRSVLVICGRDRPIRLRQLVVRAAEVRRAAGRRPRASSSGLSWLAVQVLQQRVAQQVVVGGLPHDRRDPLAARPARPPASAARP